MNRGWMLLVLFPLLNGCAALKDLVRPTQVDFPAPVERDTRLEERALKAMKKKQGKDTLNEMTMVALVPRSPWHPERNRLGIETGRWRYFTLVLHAEGWKGELGECQFETVALGEESLDSGYAEQMYFRGWPMNSPDEAALKGAFDCAAFPQALATR